MFLTFDNAIFQSDAQGNQQGKKLDHAYRTHDGKWVDSTGAFLVGELDRMDQKLHEPLAAVTWGRDMDLREDVTVADEVTSFSLTNYGSPGGLGGGAGIGTGKAWVGKDTNQIAGLSLDITRIPHPLRPWALEIKYTILELESAAKLGRPIDQQKFANLQLKHQMDTDEQVYMGDTITGDTGLVNASGVTITNVPVGGQNSTAWANKTPDEILDDVNLGLTTVWAASGWAIVPSRLLIAPTTYGVIATRKVSLAGNMSILTYVMENNLLARTGQKRLEIYPLKWCIGAGGGTIGTPGVGADAMIVYTKDPDRIRFPMTPLQRTPVQYDSLWQKSTYFGRLGVVEVVYPETVGVFAGL